MDLDALNMFLIAGGTLLIPILAFVTSFFLWPAALIKIYYWCHLRRDRDLLVTTSSKKNSPRPVIAAGIGATFFTSDSMLDFHGDTIPLANAQKYWRRALGMQVKYANYGNYRFCYTCRGRPGPKPSILMLHGFSAHKDMWLAIAKFLPKNFHLICVDLPGHEGTTRSPLDDFSISGQVKRIHQFVESINLNKRPFHLVGTSMGGCVAGVYAAQYPKDICSVTLICPAGLQYPTESKFLKHLQDLKESGDENPKIPLIPSTAEEMEQMMKLCSYVRFKIPPQVLQGLIDVRIPHNEFYRKLFLDLVDEKSRHILQEKMNKITVPAQIIWGRQDQVLDVSGADVLSNAIPGSQVEILENCGHSVVMERPRKTAKLITDFLSSVQTTENNKKHD